MILFIQNSDIMASLLFVFCLTNLFLGKMGEMMNLHSSVHQESSITSVVGDRVTLQCSHGGEEIDWYYWYKQTLGQKPRLISSLYGLKKLLTFYDEFKNNSRFALDSDKNKNHLGISDVRLSDSATYYCASGSEETLEFKEGITVSVKGSELNVSALVHQSASQTIQPGGSVTLNCTVQTGTCDGKHSVYWFRSSGESHPGLIYTNGGRNDQCERKTNTQTHTCVYNLPMKSLNVSHAGSYDSAVASCGLILFGNGTKVEDSEGSLVSVYFLSGALAFTTILTVLLAVLLHVISKSSSCQCREPHVNFSAASMNAEGHTNEDNLHYAALRTNKASRSRSQINDTNDGCVYSSVKP